MAIATLKLRTTVPTIGIVRMWLALLNFVEIRWPLSRHDVCS